MSDQWWPWCAKCETEVSEVNVSHVWVTARGRSESHVTIRCHGDALTRYWTGMPLARHDAPGRPRVFDDESDDWGGEW